MRSVNGGVKNFKNGVRGFERSERDDDAVQYRMVTIIMTMGTKQKDADRGTVRQGRRASFDADTIDTQPMLSNYLPTVLDGFSSIRCLQIK